MKKIILASGSPRRREILENIGLTFTVVESNYEEDMTLESDPQELAKHLSCGKARDVARHQADSIVIAADTFVVLDHHRLGKPHTPQKAKDTLRMISGKVVQVITGYTIIDAETKNMISESVKTDVHIKDLSSDEIDAYIDTGEPLDKAGAFGIQGHGALLIKEIHGDYFNVVGLPIFALMESLKEFGVKIL
jgi:septum formation protein